MADHEGGEGAAEEEWRFPLSDFEEDGDEDDDVVVDSTQEDATIEPGDPSLEGTVFVLLGVAFALFVVSRLFLG